MKSIIFIFIAFIFSSCVEGPVGDSTYATLINQSRHGIEVQQFMNGDHTISTFIDNNQSKDFNMSFNDPGGATGPFIHPLREADSILIIYFEKASIWHTTDVTSPVTKSLMLESSYVGGKVRDGLYEFTYTFTPEDFEEALEFGD